MLPVNPSRLPALVQEAQQHQAAGRFDQARRVLETIVATKPDLAVAHFNLAQVLLRLDQPELALQHLDRAAALKPEEAAIWMQYAKTLLGMADPNRTAAFLNKAKKARIDRKLLITLQEMLQPKSAKSKVSVGTAPPEEIKRAISRLRAGRHDEALAIAARLSQAHPDVAILWDIMGFARVETGDFEAAEQNYRRAIELDPAYAEARANYGQCLLRQGRYDEAIAQLRESLRLVPKQPLALTSLGTALHRQARHRTAITFLKRALALDPENLPARLELAESYLNERRPDDAVAVLEPVRGVRMPNAKNRVLRARSLSDLQRTDEAEAEFDAALSEATNKVTASAEKATFLQMLGRFEEAEALFRQAIKLDPLIGKTYQAFVVTKKLKPGDPLIATMEKIHDDPAITAESRMYVGFALAKALEDTGQYDRVFSYLRPANDQMRQLYPYDVADHRKTMRELMDLFGRVDFSAEDTGGSDFAPIFVTGLPRSGTTLVEQIIASHSSVTGGGELSHAYDELKEEIAEQKRNGAAAFGLDHAGVARLAERIEARMRAAFPDAERITDKGVGTYEIIGPVRRIFPRARIVVVRRDPRDTLLSMYKNVFAEGQHRYTNKLADLGAYYHDFIEIVDFWRARLPGSFHEIRYEDLIAEPEAEARKLTAACGLDWEDQCLAFHENKRRVATLSLHQVRQPLYASSMKAWQRYQDDLGELFDALGPEFDPRVAARGE